MDSGFYNFILYLYSLLSQASADRDRLSRELAERTGQLEEYKSRFSGAEAARVELTATIERQKVPQSSLLQNQKPRIALY